MMKPRDFAVYNDSARGRKPRSHPQAVAMPAHGMTLPALVMTLLALGMTLLTAGCGGPPARPSVGDEIHIGRHAPAPAARPDSLIVASYNIAFGQNARAAAAALAAHPRLGRADILLLQEMDLEGTGIVASVLGMDFLYGPAYRHPRHDRRWGTAVLSRWPIVSWCDVTLPHAAPLTDNHRRAVGADIDVAGRQVRAVSVHLSTMVTPLEDRLHQAAVVADSLVPGAGAVVVGGDFNSISQYEENGMRQVMRGAGLREARLPAGPTAEGKGLLNHLFPELELDHLFQRGLVPRDAGVARDITASDHYPVWVVYTWDE